MRLQTETDEYFSDYCFHELATSMTASYAKTVTETDIILFAGISGDINPVHLNHEFAAATRFKGPIAHGLLTASFISTVLGTRLPGPGCIYVSQNLRFKGPVRAGNMVRARVTVVQIVPDKRQVRLSTDCTARDRIMLEGDAEMLVPTRRSA